MSLPRIGFLGTGIMGGHMARRLSEAGYPVTAWNRTAAKAAALEANGVSCVSHPRDVAMAAEAVIVMLNDGPTCDEILFEEGVASAMPAGAMVVVMASIPVETAKLQAERLAPMGLHYLDAPVSGGEGGARDGTLAIMVGGAREDFTRTEPMFNVLGRPTLVGPVGSGELAKLANQIIVANTIATVAEAILFAERGGADPTAVRQALMGGFADSTILKIHGARMIDRNFVPGGKGKIQLKDCRTAMALARSIGLDLPVSEMVTELFAEMVENGGADTDHSGLYLELARRNGLVSGE
ncbi:2-hydroxy-3-oxopropionate reductase [Rhodoligotrophos appendicifer]|uniref:NAD(P)-dependent oxidoreductase n=1 Tax=Rhodoligotrophos appendicifer TaxID=987056 RepID=UPI00117BFDDB|nr:NAD(P)-dependent oxidoreductase [Rhodoligotrophos appendicifer]